MDLPTDTPSPTEESGKPLDIFHFDDDKKSFEDLGQDNGYKFWFATKLCEMLEYKSYDLFVKSAVNKAMVTCGTLGINIMDNFKQEKYFHEGKEVIDFKLSKFACYLTVMNGDPKKPFVAKAQVYFATLAAAVQNYVQQVEDVERVIVRDELKDHEKSLSSIAKEAGVVQFSYFKQKGYLGLYNMALSKVKSRKGIGKNQKLYDFINKEELAAHLFRVTQTEAKIKKEELRGQDQLEKAAFDVGRKVRHTMIDISGNLPENLPVAQDIRKIKTDLKKTSRAFKKDDDKKPIE